MAKSILFALVLFLISMPLCAQDSTGVELFDPISEIDFYKFIFFKIEEVPTDSVDKVLSHTDTLNISFDSPQYRSDVAEKPFRGVVIDSSKIVMIPNSQIDYSGGVKGITEAFSILLPGEYYELRARVYDKAGNKSVLSDGYILRFRTLPPNTIKIIVIN